MISSKDLSENGASDDFLPARQLSVLPRSTSQAYPGKASLKALLNSFTGSIVASSRRSKLLISFENVTELSSAALGVLITVHQRINEKDGQLRLTSIKPQIYELFTITKLDTVFAICDNAQEAVDGFD